MGSVTPPHPKGAGRQRIQKFGTSYMRAYGMRNGDQFLHGDQSRWGDNFHKVDHAPLPCPKFIDTDADARSVCGS